MDDQVEPTGDLVICVVAMPADTNANGDIFGGWLVSHMDMGGASAASRLSHSRVVTAAIDSMSFIKPIYVGESVSCYAQLVKIGHTSMQFKIEVWTLSPNNNVRKKVAEGVFTFVAVDDHGKPQPVKRFGE